MKFLRARFAVVAIAAVVLATGCRDVPLTSVHGISDAADRVHPDESNIDGQWRVVPEAPEDGSEPEPERYPTFVHVDPHSDAYDITIKRGHRTQELRAALVSIGGIWYFDAYDAKGMWDEEKHDGYQRPHHFFRVTPLEGGEFEIHFLSQAWALQMHEAIALEVEHTVAGEVPILIADPDALVSFIESIADNPDAWVAMGEKLVRAE